MIPVVEWLHAFWNATISGISWLVLQSGEFLLSLWLWRTEYVAEKPAMSHK